MSEYEKTYKYIDDNFSEHVKATQRLLQQPSVSLVEPGQGQDVVKCAHMIKDMIAALGAQRAEVVSFPQGFPVVFGRLNSKRPNAKTIGCYSLYDVMPAEEDNWVTPPFDAAIVEAERIDLPSSYGKCIVARGARNQKGPIMGLLNAIKSMLDTTGDIPVNVVFVFDGEEELGSMNLCGPFREQYMEELRRCDVGYYLNPSQNVRGDHVIYLGNRGICFMEMNVKGGAWGGPSKPLFAMHDLWVDSPMWTLVQALASLKAPDGTVLLDGFYDAVAPLSEESKKLIDVMVDNLDEAEMYRELGVQRFKGGKRPKELYPKVVSQPTINMDGIVGGYTGPGVKTMFPDRAKVKMDIRIVPNQDIRDILKKLRAHLDKRGFNHVEINPQGFYNPTKTSPNEAIVKAAVRATESFGVRPLLWPCYYAGIPMAIFGDPPLNKPTLGCGLGRMGREHIANEYFTVEGLRSYEKFLVAFFNAFAKM
jgi:acetylornithine deacetylase/succinyl-diaminopimelate desuccinylase-like protein